MLFDCEQVARDLLTKYPVHGRYTSVSSSKRSFIILKLIYNLTNASLSLSLLPLQYAVLQVS